MGNKRRRKGGDGFQISSSTDRDNDRISELPDPILHHILCLLPQKEASQTCVLSKSWRHLWCTRPRVEFRKKHFRGRTRTFMSVFDQTLQRYHDQNLSIKQFIVEIWACELLRLVDKWTDPTVLTNMGVETFHLIYNDWHCGYDMSSTPVFLQEFYLERSFILSIDDGQLRLKRLQKLSLNEVKIEGNTLERVMAGCPFLKRVLLDRCVWSKTDCFYSGSNSTFLEVLELRRCQGFNQVQIFSRSVKRLIIVSAKKKIRTVSIDASSMLYFEFECRSSMPSISFGAVASQEWKSNISVPFQLHSSRWFLRLNEVLKGLRQSRITLTLFYDAKRNQHINDTNCYDPVVVEHLSLRGFVPYGGFAALFNCLLQFFRPSYINTIMYSNPWSIRRLEINKLSEFICKTNHKNGEFSRCYIWQHELKELRVEVLDQNSRKWRLVQGSSFLVRKSTKCTHVRYGFKWGELGLLLLARISELQS